MGLFTRNKKEVAAVPEAKAKAKSVAPRATDRDLSGVLIRPRFTEKADSQRDQNTYVFLINPRATKFDVRDAVIALYKVTPVAVRIVNRAPAERLAGARGRMHKVPGQKKAYVQLKKGDSITLV